MVEIGEMILLIVWFESFQFLINFYILEILFFNYIVLSLSILGTIKEDGFFLYLGLFLESNMEREKKLTSHNGHWSNKLTRKANLGDNQS